MSKYYLILLAAIFFEIIGTSFVLMSQQFTRFWPSVTVILCITVSFYLMSLTLKYMPIGIVYAIWSGLGVTMIALVGLVVFRQKLDFPAILGIGLIVAGILIIHLFSSSSPH